MVNTRNQGDKGESGEPLSELELTEVTNKLKQKEKEIKEREARLLNEALILEEQKKRQDKRLREIESLHDQIHKDQGTRQDQKVMSEDLLKEIAELRREVARLRRDNSPRREPSAQPLIDDSIGRNDVALQLHIPKVSFREATESVPFFNGYNISLGQFTRACRRAKEIVHPSAERDLTKLLSNKLSGRAHAAVEDEPCDTITQLIDLLTTAFGTAKTIDQYRGELSTIYLKPQEHILDYISRVKELRSSILDTERRETGYLSDRMTADVNELTARSFCEGLPLQYRLQMDRQLYSLPFEAFARAKELAKREELDQDRFKTRERRGIEPPRNDYPRRYYNQPQPRNDYSQPLQRDAYPRQSQLPPSNNYSRRPQQQEYARTNPRNNYYQQEPYTPRNNPPRDNTLQPRETKPTYNKENTNANINAVANRYDRNDKWCRFCKSYGHVIEECKKREYVNAQKTNQGNELSPVRNPSPSHSRAQQQETRAVNVIETTTSETENTPSQL